jgi:hypothetical protein
MKGPMRILALTLASLVFAATEARAQANDEPFIEKGVELRKEHRDAEALEQFRRAEAIHPTARIKAQIALAEQAIGKWVEAERDLTAALASSDDPWIASRAPALRGSLEAIRQHLGTLVVRANVEGAEVWLNGARLGVLPMERVRVPSGTLHVEVRAKEYEPALRDLDLDPGMTLTAELVLQKVAPPAQPAASPVVVKSQPAENAPAPMASSNTRRTVAWGALAGSGLTLGGALVAQIIHNQAASHYNDNALCASPGHWRDDTCGIYRGKAETAQSVADLGFIAAGTLGVASAILFLVDGSPRHATRGGVTWSVALNGSSAALVGAGRW